MNQPGNIKFSGRATYTITVQGKLDKSRSDQLGGMTITNKSLENKTETSTLSGEIADQAALSGILNALYNMQMVVLNVEHVRTNSAY